MSVYVSSAYVGWLVVFYVPLTARSFRGGTPFTAPCEERGARVLHRSYRKWQSITLPLHHASSSSVYSYIISYK